MSSTLVTKSVEATIEPVPDDQADNPNGEFNVILATPGEDREGDDLQAKGWKQPLPDHITFDSDHGMNVKTLVGSGTPTLERDGSIRVKGTYAPTAHAQEVRALAAPPGRHIRTVSVTYLQRTVKGVGGAKHVERELLNGSFVAVPANPKAVILSSKALNEADAEDAEEPTEVAERGLAQSIHDLAAQLGAECAGDAEVDGKAITYRGRAALTIVTKGIVGSVEDLQQRVSNAVRQSAGEREYPWVRATFLDDSTSKGTVVYELDGPAGRSGTFARGFTDSGTDVELDPEVRAVSLVTTVVDDRPADAGATTKGIVDPLERAVDMLIMGGMTREAATKALGIVHTGDNLASSEQAAVVPTAAGAAATKAAAPAAQDETAAAPLDMRARALIFQLDDAAAG